VKFNNFEDNKLNPTEGLMRGMEVVDTGTALTVPV
jgi:F0F1-type ATP synthase beta subunit